MTTTNNFFISKHEENTLKVTGDYTVIMNLCDKLRKPLTDIYPKTLGPGYYIILEDTDEIKMVTEIHDKQFQR